ncbi:MAG TPA: platelet-activating factor acetylhydrolase IB subunit [Opitutaceae bacterium]|nr:platelet-activating factor acetylhydrolase IB subunit [Opitutaceae bacterium]
MKTPRLSPRFLRSLTLASALLLGAGTVTVVAASAADSALRDPQQNSAIRPEPRPGNWMKRHESFLKVAQQGGIDVLFLGDSITDFWRDPGPRRGGLAVWNREFAPLHAANFGISGDRTQHVLWRIDHGELDGIHPKVVVLMIGTNNTGFEHDKVTPRNTPAQTIEGVKAVVDAIRSKLPDTKILLLAIFPRGARADDPQRAQIAIINQAIAGLADGTHVRFLDIGPKFLQPDGTLTTDIMADHLHPTEKGYEIWAAAMKPTLMEMLGKN